MQSEKSFAPPTHPSLLLNLNTTSRHVKFPTMVEAVSVLLIGRGTKKVLGKKSFNCEKMKCKIILATNQ